MATYRKRGKSWSAQVVRVVDGKRVNKSASFSTKAEAQAWAAMIEKEIYDGRHGNVPDKPFRDVLEKYEKEVSPTKRGHKWEVKRFAVLKRDELADIRLPELKPEHFAKWRDRRSKTVAAGSVLRDWTLLSSAITTAIKEWGWMTSNPLSQVKRPPEPKARDRLPTQDEINRLELACGDDYTTRIGRVGLAMSWAIETAMRAGEICGLRWSDIDGRVANVHQGKTLAASRRVPLSQKAMEILETVKPYTGDGETVFGLSSPVLDTLFRRAKGFAMVEGLHFHDFRAEAITRLSKKLGILELARMVGHKDLAMLQVYYRETAEELAKRLD